MSAELGAAIIRRRVERMYEQQWRATGIWRVGAAVAVASQMQAAMSRGLQRFSKIVAKRAVTRLRWQATREKNLKGGVT